jgi:chromosome segregation ATPase
MPAKNFKGKPKRRVVRESSGNSSSSSGKVKAFKNPGLVLKEKQNNKNTTVAAGLAGLVAGALAATAIVRTKETVKNIIEDGGSVREKVNEAKSKIFRECKEAESKKINDLNEKNEKNTVIISENQKKIADLQTENTRLTLIVNTAESKYNSLKDKYNDLKTKFETVEKNLKFAEGYRQRPNF